jgi:hypothetical protein
LEERRDDEEEEEEEEDGYAEGTIFDRLMGRTSDLPRKELVKDLSTLLPAVASKNLNGDTDDDTEDTEDESTTDTSSSSTEDTESESESDTDTDSEEETSEESEEINSASPHPSRPRPKAQNAK